MNNDVRHFNSTGSSVSTDAAMALIVCIGTKIQFPDCLVHLISAEIEGSAYLRLSAPADLAAAIDSDGMRPQLVIVHETLWDHMDSALLHKLRTEMRSAVAVAFRDVRKVTEMLARRNTMPKGISFLPMDLNVESWLTIVRLMLTGYPFVPSEFLLMMDTLAQASSGQPEPELPANTGSVLDKLTRREREVLALVAEGFQNKQIAERLDLSEHTVKLHLHHVISKLGARNRTDAALRYRQNVAVS